MCGSSGFCERSNLHPLRTTAAAAATRIRRTARKSVHAAAPPSEGRRNARLNIQPCDSAGSPDKGRKQGVLNDVLTTLVAEKAEDISHACFRFRAGGRSIDPPQRVTAPVG
jgi:hypothetical protein